LNAFTNADSGTWTCSFCSAINYFNGPISITEQGQLSLSAYEIFAKEEGNPPEPPTYLFVIDASEDSFLGEVCSALYKLIENEKIDGKGRARIAFIAYDAYIHYYLLNKTTPSMISCSIKEKIPFPLNTLFCDLEDCKESVLTLLKSLPKAFTNKNTNSIFLEILIRIEEILKQTGGQVLFFQSDNNIANLVLLIYIIRNI